MFRDKAKDGTTRLTGGPGGSAGEPGPAGASAYEIAVDNGFVGTEEEWLDSLRGILIVNHGSVGSTARPTATVVYWIGSAEPVNALDSDWWWTGS